MFTSFDKAIVAAFGAVTFFAKNFLGLDFGLSEEAFGSLVPLVTALLVYFVPNKPWVNAA